MSSFERSGDVHVDPHGNVSPPAAAPRPPLMRDPVFPASGSMLSIVQDHWMDVCAFFNDAQCASSVETRAAVAQRLPKMEHSLNLIFDALMTERRRMGVVLRAPLSSLEHAAPGSHRVDSSSAIAAASSMTPQQPQGGRSPLSSSPSPSTTRVSEAVLANSPTSSLLQGSLVNQLPPCYFYLFAEDRRSPSPPANELDRGSDTSSAHADPQTPTSLQLAPPTPFRPVVKSHTDLNMLLNPVPVGTTFLFLLCQYAKQNEPTGARQIILRFLTRLFKEADLPARRVTTGFTDGRGKQARSVLQLFPGSSIVPLLDMIRTLGRELDPSRYAARNRRAAAGVSSPLAPKAVAADNDAERRELVLLVCELAEKAERVPELANYFVREKEKAPPSTTTPSPNGAAGSAPVHTSELLETLLPYLTHDCSAPGWEHRRDTCRYALSAALSLAKCPDPWVQDLVGAEHRLASHTLSGARVTLLTLCKIPNNDDSEMQLLYLRDVLRFWSAVHLTSPIVSQRLRLPTLVEKEFAQTTVLPLFQSTDKRVYAAACVVVASALADLQPSAGTLVSEALVEAILHTRVGAKTGTLLRRGLEAEDENKTVSFYEFYCLCHVTANPSLTSDDRAMMQALEYKISAWTATEATLVLTKAIAFHCPRLFLRHALHADPDSLASTIVSRLQSGTGAAASAPPLSAAASAPHIRLHECFSPKLRLPGDTIFGLTSETVGEDVLERMLTMESNCPVDALLSAASLMHSDEATLRKHVAPPSPLSVENSPTDAVDSLMVAGANNAWFDQNIHQSAVVISLCGLLRHGQPLPLSVKLLLSGVLSVLCALPDLRVLYTLLDPEYGRLDHALQAMRAVLENEMEDDEEVMTALGAAAAAVAEDTAPLNVPKYRDKAAAAATAAKQSRASSKECTSSAASNPSRKETKGALVHELVSFTGALYTRQYVYSVFATNWDHFATDCVEDVPEGLDVSDALCRAVAEHHEFLNTCVWLELLRVELDATVGYASLSHNLLTLQP